MANNRFNKQVTPKGYQKGGSVRDTRKTEQMIGASISSKREKGRAKKMGGGMMMKRPMMKKGGAAKGAKPITDPKVLQAIKLIKPPIGKKRLGKKTGGPVPVEKIKKDFPKASPQKIARLQTMLGDKSAPMKKERLFEGDRGRRKKMIKKLKGAVVKATPLGLGTKVAKKIKERMGKKMGGPLKPVDPKTQKGLSKLPTEVRNKMGYMKKGGKVNGK